MNKNNDALVGIMAIIGALFLIAILLTLPIYFLWNWLMPDLFGLQTINLWQALGINLLSACLFKGSDYQNKQKSE